MIPFFTSPIPVFSMWSFPYSLIEFTDYLVACVSVYIFLRDTWIWTVLMVLSVMPMALCTSLYQAFVCPSYILLLSINFSFVHPIYRVALVCICFIDSSQRNLRDAKTRAVMPYASHGFRLLQLPSDNGHPTPPSKYSVSLDLRDSDTAVIFCRSTS